MSFTSMKRESPSPVQLFAMYINCQAPLSTGFSWQEYWSGSPFPSPGALPNPGMEPRPPVSPASSDAFCTTQPLGNPTVWHHRCINFNKCTLLWGILVIGEAKHVVKHVNRISLCLPFNFSVNLNCLKKTVLIKIQLLNGIDSFCQSTLGNNFISDKS